MIWANQKLRLIVTSACNLSCFYCHNEGQHKSSAFMSLELVGHLCDMIRRYGGVKSVTISGGEPLLHPHLDRIVSHIKSVVKEVTIVTNGILLDEAKMRDLISSGASKFRIGIDSFVSPQSRPNIYHQSQSNRSIELLDSLVHENIHHELNVVLTAFNQIEIPQILSLCRTRKLSAKFFEHAGVRGVYDNGSLVVFEDPKVPFHDLHNAICQVCPDAEHSQPSEYCGANDLYEMPGWNLRYCRLLCPYGLCYMTGTRIDSAGHVYACISGASSGRILAGEPLEDSLEKLRISSTKSCFQVFA